jgi:N-acetylmuramic acid 6-phosphate etherase
MSNLFNEISSLDTERNNSRTTSIDSMNTKDILVAINKEDSHVWQAVHEEIPHIEVAVNKITEAFLRGGRLFYIGAGTSGRLGVVDASECPPTFGVDPTMVQGIIAGGNEAMFRAVEGAEDSFQAGREVIEHNGITTNDIVCGIAASGRTPFVRGALMQAQELGIYTILLTTNSRHNLEHLHVHADCIIAPIVGPEVIAGSTRMKSGTAQKLVLNMLTTASMIKIGKTYGNIMVDVQPTNDKLRERSKKIVMEITGVDYNNAEKVLSECDFQVKTALIMILKNTDTTTAQELLKKSNGIVRVALESK